MREELEKLLRFHQPKDESLWSLIPHTYCSCGEYESVMMEDGYQSLVPAKYPCKQAVILVEAIKKLKP